jgi:hypothetical protein
MRKSAKAIFAGAPVVAHSAIADELDRKGVEMLIWSEDCGVLLQAHVESGMAARMLAPLGGEAIGQFRCMPDNMVEIDAVMTHAMAAKVLAARSEAMGESKRASRAA